MIVGIGTDLVHISRIEDALVRHGDRFANRILSAGERLVFTKAPRPAAYLAKRFAIKEAASKALGTGIGKVSWQDFDVYNLATGEPALRFSGQAQALFSNKGGSKILVSIADERDLALAFVVLTT